jgi:hypothetical protein
MARSFLRPLGLALAFVGSSSLAAADTWWVDASAPWGGDGSSASPFRTVQQGIDAAAHGDEVRVLPGTYFESIDFQSKSIAVLGLSGPESTKLRGAQDGPVAHLRGGSPVLDGFTLENGSGGFVSGFWAPCGGGILIEGSSYAVVANCIVRANYAAHGDGVAVVNASGVMHSSVVESNGGYADPSFCNVDDWGGGVWASGSQFWVAYSTIRHNRTSTSGGGASGVSLDHCTIEGNVAAEGAGLSGCYATQCVIRGNSANSCDASFSAAGGAKGSTLEDCELVSNSAGDGGGAAWNCTLVRCLVRGNGVYYPDLWNHAGFGGGTWDCSLVDCVVADNRIVHDPNATWPYPGRGGGMAGGSATRTVIRDNTAGDTGGAYGTGLERCVVYGNVGDGVFLGGAVRNSILWANTGAQVAGDGSVEWSDVQGGWPGLGNLDANPLFWDAPGGDFHLQLHSPCIDRGDPLAQDPDGTRVDMGAFPFLRTECLPPVPIGACPAGPSSEGCQPTIVGLGSTSLAQSQGFLIRATDLPGQRNALVLYGTSCGVEQPWGTTTRCVGAPVQRTDPRSTGGTSGACDGSLAFDFHEWRTSRPWALGVPFAPGDVVWTQVWYRDPAAPTGSNFSPGLRFQWCP